MLKHAVGNNARRLKAFPMGFSLETPHTLTHHEAAVFRLHRLPRIGFCRPGKKYANHLTARFHIQETKAATTRWPEAVIVTQHHVMSLASGGSTFEPAWERNSTEADDY
jgi:hypothetical protein